MKSEYNPSKIDPEMVTIVENFNKAGIKTLFSCQGHFKESFDGGGQSIPYLLTELPDNPNLYSCIFSGKYPNIKIEIESFFDLEDSELDILDNYTNLEEYKDNIDKVLDKQKGYRLYFGMNYLFYNIDEKLYESENQEAYENIFEFLRKKFLIDMELLSVDLLNIRKKREKEEAEKKEEDTNEGTETSNEECDLCKGDGYTSHEYKPKMIQDGWE